MKSLWRVRTVEVAGLEHFQAFRLLDVCADDTDKNRETFGGYWSTYSEAKNLAQRLNEEDKR